MIEMRDHLVPQRLGFLVLSPSLDGEDGGQSVTVEGVRLRFEKSCQNKRQDKNIRNATREACQRKESAGKRKHDLCTSSCIKLEDGGANVGNKERESADYFSIEVLPKAKFHRRIGDAYSPCCLRLADHKLQPTGAQYFVIHQQLI